MASLEAPNTRSLLSKILWSIPSKAFERSSSTSAVICFWWIASKTISDKKMLRVSVVCCFLFPCWCSFRQFWRAIHSVSWFKAARSQILEKAGNSDTDRLSLGVSWSPYFYYGTTSDSFRVGNTEAKSDLFISSVRTGSITGSTSFQYYLHM